MRSKGLGIWLDRLAYGLFLCGVMMTALVFGSTLLRYLFNEPWHFANELTGLLFFSLMFLTIPHVLNQGGHIRLDLLTRRLPAGLARIAEALAALILLLFAVILLYESWDFMSVSYGLAARTEIGHGGGHRCHRLSRTQAARLLAEHGGGHPGRRRPGLPCPTG